jgi:small subunit ribosomal protein S16
MLAIRMQRIGRKGHAQYRVVVQDSRYSPKSGRVVAYVGSYNPHAKTAALDSDKISSYLSNGAQPSDRVSRLLKEEGIKLPKWVTKPPKKKKSIRHPEKLRRNRPSEAEESVKPAPSAEEAGSDEGLPLAEETKAPETSAEEQPAQESQKEAAGEAGPQAVEELPEQKPQNA